MIIIASRNGDVGIGIGMDILRAGGSALDTVEAACRVVEDSTADHSVGTGGYPNLLGEVELDACIMDGTDRRIGAVAALSGYPNAISVARAVMDHLPQHVMLAGDGAARFAREQGFKSGDLSTPETIEAFRSRRIRLHGESYSFDTPSIDTPAEQVAKMIDVSKTVGTVNFIAIDQNGNMASAVSTSGWAFKYPGRVGDSPIIGAGSYCDNRFGACACTGLGEWSIRASTSRTVVLGLQLGWSLEESCKFAFDDLLTIQIPPPTEPIMNLIAVNPNGEHYGCSTAEGRTYIWQTPDQKSFEVADRYVI